MYVALGAVLIVAGILEWVFARRVRAFFQRRNVNKSRWTQDVRGWSLANVRISAALMLLIGMLFVSASLSKG